MALAEIRFAVLQLSMKAMFLFVGESFSYLNI